MRSSKKRSLLDVNEHFESKRNDKVALLDSFFIYYKPSHHCDEMPLLVPRYRTSWMPFLGMTIRVTLARTMRDEGKTLQEIADALGYKHRSSISAILKKIETDEL